MKLPERYLGAGLVEWLGDGIRPDAPWADDPLWRRRGQLTMATGVKRNDDFVLYEEIIAEYLQLQRGDLAVRLRLAVGELISAETISFADRYGYSKAEHFTRLERELRRAGYLERADSVAMASARSGRSK
jgi:hypothetical protein